MKKPIELSRKNQHIVFKCTLEMLKFVLSTRFFFHIIAVMETKLDPNLDASSIVHLDNYILLRRDCNKNGGVVVLFIYNYICSTILCSSDGIWSGKPGKPDFTFTDAFVGLDYHWTC